MTAEFLQIEPPFLMRANTMEDELTASRHELKPLAS